MSYFKTNNSSNYSYFKPITTTQSRVVLTGQSQAPLTGQSPAPSSLGNVIRTTPSGYRDVSYSVFDQAEYDRFAAQKQAEAKQKELGTVKRVKEFESQRLARLSKEELTRRKQLIGKERVTVKQPTRLTQARKAPSYEPFVQDIKQKKYVAAVDVQKTSEKEYGELNKEIEKINKELQEYKPMKTLTYRESATYYVSPEGKKTLIDPVQGQQYAQQVKEYKAEIAKIQAQPKEIFASPSLQQSFTSKEALLKAEQQAGITSKQTGFFNVPQQQVFDKYFDIPRAKLASLTGKEKRIQTELQDIEFRMAEEKLLGRPVQQVIREQDLRKVGAIAGLGVERSFDIGKVSEKEVARRAELQTQLFSTQQQKKLLGFEIQSRTQTLDSNVINKQLEKEYNIFRTRMEQEYGTQAQQEQAQVDYQKQLDKAYSFDPQKVATEAGVSAGLGGTLGFFTGGPAGAAGGAASLGALAVASASVRSGTYSLLGGLEDTFGKEQLEFFYPSIPSPKKFVEQVVSIQKGETPLFSSTSPLQYFGKSKTPISDYLVEESYFEPGTRQSVADFAGLVTFFGGAGIAEKTIGKVAESGAARLYTRALGFKQIDILGTPALIKKGKDATFVFVSDIHKNPLLGDISEKKLRVVLGLGKGEKIRMGTAMGTFPGFDPKAGQKYLATQQLASKKPWATPQYDPLYTQPGVKKLTLFSRQFGPGLGKTPDYGAKATYVFKQPKALGLSFYEKVYDPLSVSKSMKGLLKQFDSGMVGLKRSSLGEAQRLYAGKVFSGKFTEPIENVFRKILEPQASLQKQGFMLSTTQKIRGSGLFIKEKIGSPYFYDTLALPGKKTLLQLQKAPNVLGSVFRKTSFTKNLEKVYQQLGFGRDYKQISLFDVEPFIPRGRPPKEVKVLPRETARYLEVRYKQGVREYKLLQERSGKFGTGGGAIDPIYDPKYYVGSKIGMKGGRIVLDSPTQTIRKELLEELGARALIKKRLPITAMGEPYTGKFFYKGKLIAEQQFRDFTKNVFVVKGVLKTKAPVHAGEILGKKWFTAEQVLKSKQTDAFTKQIISRAEKSLTRMGRQPVLKQFGYDFKAFTKGIKTKIIAPKKISARTLGDYYSGNVKYVSPTTYLAPAMGVFDYGRKAYKQYSEKPFMVSTQEYKPLTYRETQKVVGRYSVPGYKETLAGGYEIPKILEYKPPVFPREYKIPGYKPMKYVIPTYKVPPYEPPNYRYPPVVPPRTPPVKTSLKEKQEQERDYAIGTYHAFVRRDNNSKWVKVTAKAKPYNMAFNKGLMFADNTVARSVKLKRVSKTFSGMDDPFIAEQKFRRRVTGSKVPGEEIIFVEKTEHLIDTIGEKQGLSAAKYMKEQKQVNPFNFMFNKKRGKSNVWAWF